MSAPSVLKLGYSLCWEDPELDLEALRIQPGHRIVTISSAGCNALSLLLADPESILAVDYNPIQNRLLELKMAAVSALDRQDYFRFSGEEEGADRLGLFQRFVAPRLPGDASRQFWNERQDWIAAGVNQAGSLERHFATWRRLMRLIQGTDRVGRMFASRSREERERFFRKDWNQLLYRGIVRLFFNRTSLGFAKHPDHFRYVTEQDVAGNFLEKCRHALVDLDVPSNYFLARIFLGRYLSHDAVPPFLREGDYERVKERLDRIQVVTGDLASVLNERDPASIDAFYLSNVCEWLVPSEVERIFASLTRAAVPGARATCRALLADRQIPPPASGSQWQVLEDLSADLLYRDRSFLYSSFKVLENSAGS